MSDDAIAARNRLLASIAEGTDLPALGSSVTRVVQMASSSDEAVRNLASFVLADAGLTQKILRVANTVVYRTYSGAPITTVSKAIFMLGFETVKTNALAMLLVDGMSGNHAQSVRAELAQSLAASVIGREMAKRSQFKDAEEAAVAALFKNMGRLLVAAHDHTLYGEVATLIEAGKPPSQASMQVLGCTFEMLAGTVLQEWQIPDTTIKALATLPSGALRPAKSRQEWMQQVAAFSGAAAALLPKMGQAGQEAASRALLSRYGSALNLDADSLAEMFESVKQEIEVLTTQAGLGAAGAAEQQHVERHETTGNEVEEHSGEVVHAETEPELGLPSELLMTVAEEKPQAAQGRHPSGKPLDAREQLMAGVHDVTEMMASGRSKVNDLIMLVLETIYRGMGFRFATICVKDAKTGNYRARIALGEQAAVRQDRFVFAATPAANTRDLFHLAMENDADLMIADAAAPKIRELIPSWHRSLLPDAKSFIVLPLVVHKKPFGFFYADRILPAPEGVPPDETALIRTLKGQVLAALNAR
ncbi:MAG: HDOD domain-containing protein [Burkholderiaceae bacterium]|nr:HDOD domain-containing protein [Burkholderiaceae bacterium]